MKIRILLAGALVLTIAGTAMGDEYYVIASTSAPHCIVATSKPAELEIVKQIGPIAFKSREEAEARIRQTKACHEGTIGSGSTDSTTIQQKD
jgi:hypothetical protein